MGHFLALLRVDALASILDVDVLMVVLGMSERQVD